MSIKHIINSELKDLSLDFIIEGLNEIINTGNFTTVLSEDGDVVADIVNDELNKNNCTLEEEDNNIENNINDNIESQTDNMLSEGLSDILYHYTYIPHLRNILKYNKFATSTNLGSSADASKDKGKFFFFSTQRTKGMSGYAQHHENNVAIVLDGRKLNYTFKGFATDYWNWSKKRSEYQDLIQYLVLFFQVLLITHSFPMEFSIVFL